MNGKFRTATRIRREFGFSGLWLVFRFRLAVWVVGLARRLVHFDPKGDPVRVALDDFFSNVNTMSGPRVLELGACNFSRKTAFHSYSEYVGFDIHPGPHVDVTGDIHRLSEYFPENHFDVVYAVSVFEHLAMPWKAVEEINKVLKPGGTLFIFTHHTFPLHAEPWDFWRFSREAFRVLLNRETGYEVLRCDMGQPCIILSLERVESLLRAHDYLSYMGVSVTARKIGGASSASNWDVDARGSVEGLYPLDATTAVKASPILDYMTARRVVTKSGSGERK